MAVISQEKFYLKNHGQIQKVVKYIKGRFSIELPEIVCKEMNFSESERAVTAPSEDEVNRLFKAKIEEWINAVTVSEKKIIFRAKFQGALASKDYMQNAFGGKYVPHGGSQYQGMYEFKSQSLSITDDSIGLTIEWGVFNKKTVNGKSDYTFVSGRKIDISRGNGRLTEIDHTEERERFFLELDESFANMIAKVHRALGDLTPDKLLLLADSGLRLIG